MNRLSDATLNGMTKKQLIEYVRMCEHNYDIAEETLRQQAENVKDWRPVKRGKWVETKPDEEDRKIGIDFRIECSECHDENSHITTNDSHEITGKVFWRSKFCPNCGAYMREEAHNVD